MTRGCDGAAVEYPRYCCPAVSVEPNATTFPAVACTLTSLPSYRTFTGFDSFAVIVTLTSLPSFHSIATSRPPRAFSPLTLPVRQRRGQRRQQVHERRLARLHRRKAGRRGVRIVALQQHLGDPRGRAEVAVDLERRMRVEQVRRTAPRCAGLSDAGVDQVLQNPVRVVAVQEPRPEVHLPAHATSRWPRRRGRSATAAPP